MTAKLLNVAQRKSLLARNSRLFWKHGKLGQALDIDRDSTGVYFEIPASTSESANVIATLPSASQSPLLQRLRALPHPIQVGLIGMGSMGQGLLHQCRTTPGFRCVAVADLNVEKAAACAQSMGMPWRLIRDAAEMQDAVVREQLAVCCDGMLVAGSSDVQVLIESSSAIADAGRFCLEALATGKSLVMMNAEADLIFGPHLMCQAHSRGLVYTSCDGDQHGVIKHLADDIGQWGFPLVMAGNIKGFLDRYSNPTKIVLEADKRRLDYKMATAYTDGTKLSIEMALVANALGLKTQAPGMSGPRACNVNDVFRLFDFCSIWEGREPCVDYIVGAEPGGGVFAIGYCDDVYQRQMLAYYKMGPGPFYLFYRPYHLCHIEALESVADAVLDGRALLEPTCGFRTNVYAYAKRDLREGEMLDGIGGYACYGLIENCGPEGHPGLPICLADDLPLRRQIRKDQPILMADVEVPSGRIDFELYHRAQADSAHLL